MGILANYNALVYNATYEKDRNQLGDSMFCLRFVAVYHTFNYSTFCGSSTTLPYWMLLHRASNKEFLYRGIPGDKEHSLLVKTFNVKTGIPGERPTPLPQLVGREYWLITDKEEAFDNAETAPYFLTLNVPGIDKEPYGPVPYTECNGQCNWILPGKFGLHGVNGDPSRLSKENPGSSGCIRHTDEDITFLYKLLEPDKEGIRYYVR